MSFKVFVKMQYDYVCFLCLGKIGILNEIGSLYFFKLYFLRRVKATENGEDYKK